MLGVLLSGRGYKICLCVSVHLLGPHGRTVCSMDLKFGVTVDHENHLDEFIGPGQRSRGQKKRFSALCLG